MPAPIGPSYERTKNVGALMKNAPVPSNRSRRCARSFQNDVLPSGWRQQNWPICAAVSIRPTLNVDKLSTDLRRHKSGSPRC